MEFLNFIGGEFLPAENQQFFEKKSPFDGSTLGVVAKSEPFDFIKALQVAKKTAPVMRDLAREERAQILIRMADYLESHGQDLALQEALHQGLPQSFVFENSIQGSVTLLRETAASLTQGTSDQNLRQPVGLVSIIASWNLSLLLILERLAPALAAGNVCLVKISEHSPITGKILGEILQFAQAPAGAVAVLQGTSEIAELLAAHPGVRAVTAVGQSSTMEAIAKSAISQFKKVQLSGSAKNSALILAETDFKKDMDKIMSSFLIGQGQLCWNTSRLFVLESIAQEFTEALQEYLSQLRPLRSPQGREVWTPLMTEHSLHSLDEKRQVGVQEHGRILYGGQRLPGPGNFVEPIVMQDLPNCSVLQQDEIPGPLILVTPVKYQHEAVKWTNNTYLGHSAVLWGNSEKAMKVAQQLECAHVWINSWMGPGTKSFFGHKQGSFGNPDRAWSGSFYSDVKKLAGL